MTTPILEARDLSKLFPGPKKLFTPARFVTAVDRVSLSVLPGETLAIVGESGSGKSTLGRLLLRLLGASEGRVFYQGEEITHASGARLNQLRRELQIIFQDPFASLNPRMTVEQIVGEPLWLHQNMKKADPQYHVEPVSALDVSVQAQVVNLLESLKHQLGLTMVIVAHGLAVIRHMSDRVAVMYLGQIVELATVDDIFDAPLHPYTQALIASAPQMQPGVARDAPLLQGDLPNPANPPSGCRFHTRCPYVSDECRLVEPIHQVIDGGRQVACHRWQEINRDRSVIQIAPPSAAFLRRRALFEHAATHSSLPSRNS